ncbi:iron-containing alcohol dehydrogenase [Anaerosporobacter faecicola]|uniref:iron-containing alcohol dehydrogenase n=1 Tax=Anaerosporobacter faecicola TaxID=2718714 RepID=UPI00143A6040|nr:iron-containing alcohol dehydrogenase [Anaerosporobacter faecicola]
MNNFKFHARTDIRFGKEHLKDLPKVLGKYGANVLMVYGGGSIKKIGLYNTIKELLQDFNVVELSGVEPNPKITSVQEGVRLCKEHNIDVVLAVGGGSCIDASKVIAAGAFYEGDPWDLVLDSKKIKKVLPIVTVLTLAATGSEMNKNAVISNMETNEKFGTASQKFIPMVSFLDPSLLYTLPKMQTAAGTADIMSHVFEQYFQENDSAYLSDCLCESIIKTCIKYCPVALNDPEDYEARSNLMWASTLALNGLICAGKGGPWTCHPIEHELSAYFDITHGVGLAIITPSWMRYILSDKTMKRFCNYARNVWGLQGEDSLELAKQGIDKTYEFFLQCGIPMKLREVGITEDSLHTLAKATTRHNNMSSCYVALSTDDVENILKDCY